MSKEVWKDIEGYEGHYQVSSLGRVKSLDRVLKQKNGRDYNAKGKVLAPSEDKDGYYQVSLYRDGIREPAKIHRLVAQTFIPNPENKLTVDHIDTDITNNTVDNLRWFTHKQQVNDNKITKARLKDHVSTLGKRYGAENGKKKIKRVICLDNGMTFESAKDAADWHGCSISSIRDCCTGKNKTSGGLRFKYIED